ncbi:unnamed protein product [Zymoseptoria tritici ST99CH_1E4]|uniref:F-box domain-containing protein n=1 Tax=Zymoseptoria tritici ST99CH_1E4 TaxID=1276532 RepID=A0A2H1GYE5_ZYMTR|nr:unnamed protein product [Zymoseptoria tritici ST99CH_1E4]
MVRTRSQVLQKKQKSKSKSKSKTTITLRAPPRSHLLRLPEEVQSRIFKYALQDDYTRCTRKKFRCAFCVDKCTHFSEPALLRTCSQIRITAGDIWYGNATFYVHDGLQHCVEFLKFLGPGRMAKLGLIKDEPSFGGKEYAEEFLKNLHKEAKRCGMRLRGDAVEVSYRLSNGEDGVEKVVALRTAMKTERRGSKLSISRTCVPTEALVECEAVGAM